MRKILIILLALILTGCGKVNARTDRMKVECGAGYNIMVDTQTGVTYLDTIHGVTVMVDHNGDPYIQNGFRDWGGNE